MGGAGAGDFDVQSEDTLGLPDRNEPSTSQAKAFE
jgi:hypothetical protein